MPFEYQEPESYWDDMDWAREHSTELHRQFENQWVAIVDKQIVAHDPDPAVVERIACERTGNPVREIVIRFIEDSGAILGENPIVL